MSKLTQEELGYLYNFVYRGSASIRADKHDELKSKLQLMIDSSVAEQQYDMLIKRRDEITKDIKKLEAFLLSEGK